MLETTMPVFVLSGLLFTLMGPIAAMPMFAAATAGADRPLQVKIALAAYATALVTLAVSVFIGAGALAGWGVAPSSLIIAAGAVLTLTALRGVLGGGHEAPAVPEAAPTVATGFAPIAIPGLVTPITVAVLVIFVSYFPAMSDKLAVMGVAAAIMTLNLGAMLGAAWFMRVIGPAPLVVLGAVFGVLQVALGIQMIISGLGRSPIMG